ncbi:MAG: hypothetical protein ACOYL6_17265 [Bacteriovoracaceae bacterium]
MKKLIMGMVLLSSLAGVPLAQAQSFPAPPKQSKYVQPQISYINAELMDEIVDVVNAMRSYVSPKVFASTYSPLRTRALKCKSMIRTYGLASATTQTALVGLSNFILNNDESMEELWEIDAFYETADLMFNIALKLQRDLR